MDKQRHFCTCTNQACPLHSSRHDKGCTMCIRKNLRLREIPACFFNLLAGAEHREGDAFADFAKLVLSEKQEKNEQIQL